jgi:hypothetical protein
LGISKLPIRVWSVGMESKWVSIIFGMLGPLSKGPVIIPGRLHYSWWVTLKEGKQIVMTLLAFSFRLQVVKITTHHIVISPFKSVSTLVNLNGSLCLRQGKAASLAELCN